MNAQIFLIAPSQGTDPEICTLLDRTLAKTGVSALYLPQGARDDNSYEDFARQVLPIAHRNGCAVLLENQPQLAKKIGADGAHINRDLTSVKEALSLLKPDMIVGAGNITSRDEAMIKGESGVDYVLFGTPEGRALPQDQEFAAWWAENFEVPAVFSDPEASRDELTSNNCEFIALSEAVWHAPEGPERALSMLAAKFGSVSS